MTQVIIPDILPYTQSIATGGQTVYGTTWTANYPSDVVVYSTPSGSAPNDVTQILSYPSQYSVAFIGDQQTVQVTLVTPSNAGDIVTVTRQTPADRENLYTNTNFTPSMLNNDFGILTLVDQQNQLVNQQIAPRYNYSALITNVVDTILPILGANQAWVKNSGNTGFIGYTLPTSGIAPAADTYVLLTPDSGLPNSLALSTLSTGFMVNQLSGNTILSTYFTGTTNQITVTNGFGTGGPTNIAITPNPIIPGTAGMGIPVGTTAQRIIPLGSNISLRYNTSLESLEYYTGTTWSQLNDDTQVVPGLTNQLAWYASNGDQVSGLATVAAGVLTTVSSVPTWASQLSLGLGGTNASLTASNGGIVYSTASALAILSGTATAGLPLLSGSSTTPAWGAYALSLGGALTTAGAHTLSGAYASTFTFTGATNVTFPTSGTLATTAGALTTINADSGSATVTSNAFTITGGSTGLTTTGTSATISMTGTLAIGHGGTGVTSVTTAPTASSFAGWDANKNFSAVGFIPGYTTTVTSSSPVTLTVGSNQNQYFTGSTAQTVIMPVASTVALGQSWNIINNSTATVTIQSSGANTILALPANSETTVTCILASGTSAASWVTSPAISGSGTVSAGTINQLAYYSATGDLVSGLATGNNGVLVTSNTGVPSISSTLPSGMAATNLNLTTPVLGTPQSGNLVNCTGYPQAPYSNVVISSSNSGAFSTASTTPVAVTNMTVSITTKGGPVLLKLQGTTSASYIGQVTASDISFFSFYRGVTQLNLDVVDGGASGLDLPPGSLCFIDTPTAGTYTYTLQCYNNSAGTTLVNNCNLVAMEI